MLINIFECFVRNNSIVKAKHYVNKLLCLQSSCLEDYVANRLILLDKSPGVRTIGICEIQRRLVGKSLAKDFKMDSKEAAGPIQVCAGHGSGAEAAIHAMQQIWDEENTEGVLLIDASYAFNALNRAELPCITF